MPFRQVDGDLLRADADVIVQQCNCISTYPKGLAEAVERELGVCPYRRRRPAGRGSGAAVAEDHSLPGTVDFVAVEGRPGRPRYVACLYGQVSPGRARGGERASDRLRWFIEGLERVAEWMGERDLRTVALPWQIGCGWGGGSWDEYEAAIREWSSAHEDLEVSVVRLPQ